MIIRTGTEERLTGKLRWLRRTANSPGPGVFDVLQQEWEITQYYALEGTQPAITREWRDVPVLAHS